jgi:hypothetical protein
MIGAGSPAATPPTSGLAQPRLCGPIWHERRAFGLRLLATALVFAPARSCSGALFLALCRNPMPRPKRATAQEIENIYQAELAGCIEPIGEKLKRLPI